VSELPVLPPRAQPIGVGEPAPLFDLPAVPDGGEQFQARLADYLSYGRTMLVFYQDDGMPICTRELTAFALDHALLEGAGVQVFGINTNGLGSHRKFQERDHFPFPLISDFHGEAVKAYGFWDAEERKSRRALVLVGEGGTVRHVVPHFNPGNVNGKVEIFAALGLA